MEHLGLSISWILILVGEAEGPAPIITGVVNIGRVLTVFISCGFIPSVSFQFTTGGTFKTRPAMHAASVTIYFEIIVQTACKVPPLVSTPSVVVWLIGRMTTEMISGMSWLTNNSCGEFPLIV